MPCESCTDKAKERNANIEAMRLVAKNKSNEEKQAIAICEEVTDGSLFTTSVNTAIAQHFLIREVINVLQ